ncbi:MAG: hypothetical protein M4D80_24885 [Myxococcota bacterium]|nr:hypothetical protein [Myxococcota bacterium]
MRSITCLLLLAPSLAAAENRLDLEPIPDLGTLEPVHHLDRGTARKAAGIAGHIGIGYGNHGDDKGLVGEGSLRIGMRMRQLTVAGTSDLVGAGSELVRGRHTGYLELRTDNRKADKDDISGSVAIGASVEHGEARGLAPVYIGPGKRNHGAANADLLIGLEPDKDAMIWAALVTTDGSVTRWLDAPLLDHAYRGAFGLGVSFAPNDGEIPRGRIDLLRARVEHANIKGKSLSAAGGVAPFGDTQVRTIEVMSGVHGLTSHIDREMLFVVTAELGAAWIESDALLGRMDETLFKMDISGHFKWRRSRIGRREFGFAFARQPGTTPDGQHLVRDWRLEMIGGAEDKHFVLSARGGISWIKHLQGGDTIGDDTRKRYGSHIEGFVKLGFDLELGGYHSMTYEARVAGDPWSSPREWSSEVGVLARWRPSTY